ncbi:MAG: bifunctional phosphoribosylaminoimidazolecarboxamide formyltransferase/IMP cyclohydrolase [Aquiluna sp.]|nr:bifunctional phosphoribosylaminoimidazolecarboxamide formyltransferase/IMP cyclohydrolase [Aquiluna sp.]
MTENTVQIRRALISVSDKTGLIELATALVEAGVELVSTGSTAKQIAAAGLSVKEVSEVTGFPESLDGRVKTLHPKIHGGILADVRLEKHRSELEQLDIQPFQLVVVNLYPFVETVASGAQGEDVIEQIDIGGPAMVRAAAKNHANVVIVVEPDDYSTLIETLNSGGTTFKQRRHFAGKAFAHTASYDTAVANWFQAEYGQGAQPERLNIALTREQELRYGENSHQAAALYKQSPSSGIAAAKQHSGKQMSYNNYVDADAALRAAHDFKSPAVAIIKHANPCGVATAEDIGTAYALAHETDPVSAFGGVIATNREVSEQMAIAVAEVFTEVIIAPGYSAKALEVLEKKKNLRILELAAPYARPETELRQISGGMLVQDSDGFDFFSSEGWQLVSGEAADEKTMKDLEFAWIACRAVKSNAILLASNQAAVGIGMGQVNRLDSCHLAVTRAGDRVVGSVAASDAFFPFSDGLEVLIEAGVRAVVQPGGSMRDQEVIDAATKAGVTMYFTGERHFFH